MGRVRDYIDSMQEGTTMNKATKAREDKDGTAQPLTMLVGELPRDAAQLPGGRNAKRVRLVERRGGYAVPKTAREAAAAFMRLAELGEYKQADRLACSYVSAGKNKHAVSCRKGFLRKYGIVSWGTFYRACDVAKALRLRGSDDVAKFYDYEWNRRAEVKS
jgi:hypothetical protein